MGRKYVYTVPDIRPVITDMQGICENIRKYLMDFKPQTAIRQTKI